MDVIAVVRKVLRIANSVIGKSAFPNFTFSADDTCERMRITALDKLNSVLKGYVIRRSQ